MNITDLTFKKETELGISVIDFWAPWCGPCRNIAPIIEELEKQYKESGVKILKVNVDECPELTLKFGIRSIPTIVTLKNGQETERSTGSGPLAEKIAEMVLKAEKA